MIKYELTHKELRPPPHVQEAIIVLMLGSATWFSNEAPCHWGSPCLSSLGHSTSTYSVPITWQKKEPGVAIPMNTPEQGFALNKEISHSVLALESPKCCQVSICLLIVLLLFIIILGMRKWAQGSYRTHSGTPDSTPSYLVPLFTNITFVPTHA